MDNSPYCGLILNNPRRDDFLNTIRGYSGAYNKSTLKYKMTTSLLKFEQKKDDKNPVWYPCKPENTMWDFLIYVK